MLHSCLSESDNVSNDQRPEAKEVESVLLELSCDSLPNIQIIQ